MSKFVMLHKLDTIYDNKGAISGNEKGRKIAVNIDNVFTVETWVVVTEHTIITPVDGRNSITVFESFDEVDKIFSNALR